MQEAINQEWIITNGLGGYASSTVIGENTRSYHGLLIASNEPPTDRTVVVAKMEERILLNGIYHDLSVNEYAGSTSPNTTPFLERFEVAPFPLWYYKGEDWALEKSIFIVQNANTSLLTYTNKGNTTMVIELHSLYSFSSFHENFHENKETNFYSEVSSNGLKTYPQYGAKPVFTRWTLGEFIEARAWYKNIELPIEKSRGLEDNCDYYRIGYISYELKPNESITVLYSIDESIENKDINALLSEEKERIITAYNSVSKTFYNDLLRSGSQFIVKRKSTNSASIIAGYHWFSDWGRDTMISMRGLTITTADKDSSMSILATFFKNSNQGMIPNRFPDNSDDKVEYNTIDASLWLFVAVHEFHHKFQDLEFIKEHITALKDILDWHINGSRYDIHVTPEGFLYGGQEGVQLTWMDAIVNGKVITPRIGCPVEINALWYNALKIYAEFCKVLEIDLDPKFTHLMLLFESNFENFFINNEGTLYDVITPNKPSDNSFRPNQIYCLSLPFTLLNLDQQKTIFQAIKAKLYTPFGLRTLDKDDSQFVGVYKGNQWERDHAYHQGTVWPYLIGEYYEAFFKLYGATNENKRQVIEELKPLQNHFYKEQGLHCISEVFDGENPKQGKGTIQQAWSIAALLKLYTDYQLYEL